MPRSATSWISTFFGLDKSFHTEGFFGRESSHFVSLRHRTTDRAARAKPEANRHEVRDAEAPETHRAGRLPEQLSLSINSTSEHFHATASNTADGGTFRMPSLASVNPRHEKTKESRQVEGAHHGEIRRQVHRRVGSSRAGEESRNLPPEAEEWGKVWREHGALEYIEAIADDVKPGKVTSFPQALKLEPNEKVVLGLDRL